MAKSAEQVSLSPKPVKVGAVWCLVATHALSGQQEHIVGFHNEVEAKEWLASKGCGAWLRSRGYFAPSPRQLPRPFPTSN